MTKWMASHLTVDLSEWNSTVQLQSGLAPSPKTNNDISSRNVRTCWTMKDPSSSLTYYESDNMITMSIPVYNFYTNVTMDDSVYWQLFVNLKNPEDKEFAAKLALELK
jgi:hypothetical protein